MSKRILSFEKFSSLNEAVAPAQPSIIKDALAQAAEIEAGKSKKPEEKSDSQDSLAKINLRDLFFATSLGQDILTRVDSNPELKKAWEKAKIIPSDSPDSVEDISASLDKNAESKKAAEENINALNKSGIETSSPKYSELIQSSDYQFDDTQDLTWDSLKYILDQEGISKSLDFDKYNLVGLRNYLNVKKNYPNRFTDVIFLLGPEKEKKIWKFPGTTVPGPFFLVNKFRNWFLATGAKNTLNPEGVAIMQPGVYDYTLGTHRGQYEALVPSSSAVVQRYSPVDDPKKANFATFSPGKEQKGDFGLNIHRGLRNGVTPTIDSHSAGCIVLKDAGDFRKLLSTFKDSGQKDIKFALVELDEVPKQVLAKATDLEKTPKDKTSRTA